MAVALPAQAVQNWLANALPEFTDGLLSHCCSSLVTTSLYAAARETAMPKYNCVALLSHALPAMTQIQVLREVLVDADVPPKERRAA